MKRIGQLAFVGAFALSLTLHALTAPDGLPWNASTHLALAYLGEIVRLPVMPHPVWGCYVQVFGGAVALSVAMAAVAAGLIAVLVNRYFGWRFAASASIVWAFLPCVWNRAITGERGICLASVAVVMAWALNWIAEQLWRKLRAIVRKSGGGAQGLSALPSAHGVLEKRGMVNRFAGWVAIGAAGLFAVVSLTFHDYRYGEAASAFARGVVEEAGERVIVLNGVCDDQVVVEIEKRQARRNALPRSAGQPSGEAASQPLNQEESDAKRHVHSLTPTPTPTQTSNTRRVLALRNDDVYRTNLVAWVRSVFPTETNLWVAAQVGMAAFVEAASRKHPGRFYLMGGKSTALEAWESRWESFKPYLGSSDPFVRVGRRAFAVEGNGIANAMLDEGEMKADAEGRGQQGNLTSVAWHLYKRIYTEIDPGNFSALVNMGEMIRRGYAVGGDEKKKVQGELEKFFRDVFKREHAREIVRAAGPVRVDAAFVERMAAEAKKRVAEKVAAGEKVECPPEILSLIEWNNEMVRHMNKGEIAKAGRIARAILSNPAWRDFIPARAVMGSVAAREGDYVTSEAFFRVVSDTTNAVPAVVLNDYADVLLQLGKLDEAERMARRSVKGSEESFWIARLTLAQVLERKRDKANSLTRQAAAAAERASSQAEIRVLLKSALKYAPAKACDRIRKEHKGFVQ